MHVVGQRVAVEEPDGLVGLGAEDARLVDAAALIHRHRVARHGEHALAEALRDVDERVLDQTVVDQRVTGEDRSRVLRGAGGVAAIGSAGIGGGAPSNVTRPRMVPVVERSSGVTGLGGALPSPHAWSASANVRRRTGKTGLDMIAGR